MENVVELEDVTRWLGDKPVLEGVNWSIEEGQHWAILGLNGSGKTTLLRIASAYLWPSSGTVTVLGHRMGSVDVRKIRPRIGWVSNHLDTRMPAAQNALDCVLSGKYASVGLYDEPTRKDIRKAKDILEFMDCSHLAERGYGVLSQGEKQRVLIARALMSEPRLLILDEPCAGLDVKSREKFLNYVSKLSRNDLSIAYVTHHIEEIVPEITHVLLLKDGKVHASGAKETVLDSKTLSEAFTLDVIVRERESRYYMSFSSL